VTAAEKNELQSPEQLEAQAKRLLATEASYATLVRFVTEWLGIQEADGLQKNAAIYPGFNSSIARLMKQETERFVRAVLTESDGRWTTLMSAPWTMADGVLGKYYGVSGGSPDVFQKVSLPLGERAGLLTHGSVMATFASADQTSPIKRGKFFRERVLCQKLPAPPKQLVVKPPAQDAAKTTRARFKQHSSSPSCYSCHAFIDPPGFLFENYDGAGAYRTMENGQSVDASGELIATTSLSGTYTNIVELLPLLTASDEAQGCFVEMMMQSSMARPVVSDECAVGDAKAAFTASGTRLHDVLLSYIRSDAFVTRAKETP
jgi:hypothetical protein